MTEYCQANTHRGRKCKHKSMINGRCYFHLPQTPKIRQHCVNCHAERTYEYYKSTKQNYPAQTTLAWYKCNNCAYVISQNRLAT